MYTCITKPINTIKRRLGECTYWLFSFSDKVREKGKICENTTIDKKTRPSKHADIRHPDGKIWALSWFENSDPWSMTLSQEPTSVWRYPSDCLFYMLNYVSVYLSSPWNRWHNLQLSNGHRSRVETPNAGRRICTLRNIGSGLRASFQFQKLSLLFPA